MKLELFEKTPEESLIRGLLAIKEKYHCSWEELIELPISAVFEMWKEMEEETKEIKKAMKKK